MDIAYEQSGPFGAPVVVLLHGYPYDVRAFDRVVSIVNAAELRTIVPYLRGYPLPTVRASMRRPRRDSSDTPNVMLRCGKYCSATPCDRMHTKHT